MPSNSTIGPPKPGRCRYGVPALPRGGRHLNFRQSKRLVIAKLDRLSRNLAFRRPLMESGVEFVAVDNPHAILAAVAEHEREARSAPRRP
jgi:hypothetical protein